MEVGVRVRVRVRVRVFPSSRSPPLGLQEGAKGLFSGSVHSLEQRAVFNKASIHHTSHGREPEKMMILVG